MPSKKNPLILIRGAGEMATGVARTLHRAGFRVVMAETAEPRAIRRAIAFSEAVYVGAHSVEGVTARRAERGGTRGCRPTAARFPKNFPRAFPSADFLLQ